MGMERAPGPGVFLTELPVLNPDTREPAPPPPLVAALASTVLLLARSDKDDSSAYANLTDGFDNELGVSER